MNITELPYRATSEQACNWLALHTDETWNVARLLEHGLTPYVWLDYDAAMPELFGDANGGYPAPIFFKDDIQRLIDGYEDVIITITKDVDNIVSRLPAPGIGKALHELRFLKKDLQKLLKQLQRQALAETATPQVVASTAESQDGINKAQVLIAFSGLAKINLEQALDSGLALFSDDGARVKSSTKKAKNKIVWNPVTLALGFNDLYRVPMSRLSKVFQTHDFLDAWEAEWRRTLELLDY
ncbi:hypothetical protein ACO0KY_00400 [Undibacterium sp. Dicai25W]|uniref:hypothetical protein n=1 Tax=Undibacterium sp. Dicai25W TaxID=3413034 RepID=UPI003BF1205A